MTVGRPWPAFRNVEAIQDFLAKDSPSAAHRRARTLIERPSAILADNPLAGRVGRVDDTRELVVAGTPLIVVYRLRQGAEILAVVHGARDWPESLSG